MNILVCPDCQRFTSVCQCAPLAPKPSVKRSRREEIDREVGAELGRLFDQFFKPTTKETTHEHEHER